MSTRPAESTPATTESSPWATGFAVFAGVMMVIGGVMGVLAGLSAIFHDQVFVTTPTYTYAFDLTTWGWVHLVVGAVLAFAGISVVQGATWARMVGIGVAGLSMLANFAFLPYYPLWAILLIAIDVVVIWALATYRRAD
jgi:hypothetical protein